MELMKQKNKITLKEDKIPYIKQDENGNYPDIPPNQIVKIDNLLAYQFNKNPTITDIQNSEDSRLFYQ